MELSFPLPSTFVALPLENEPKWQFQALQEELKEFDDVLRFQNPQTPHLTLQFWPEVMEIEYQQILEQCTKLSQSTDPFSIKVTGVSTFGSQGEDRVLYLDIAFSEELARLKKSCPWVSDRPFAPHITLARMKHPQKFAVVKKKVMKKLEGIEFEVPFDRIRLYAEIGRAKQTPLEDFTFGSL